MSFTTIQMADTFPEGDLLNAFDELETKTISGFAELMYIAYHRGRRQQTIRCIVQYMYHEEKTYHEAIKLFNYPLIEYENLHDAVIAYYGTYVSMMRGSKE